MGGRRLSRSVISGVDTLQAELVKRRFEADSLHAAQDRLQGERVQGGDSHDPNPRHRPQRT